MGFFQVGRLHMSDIAGYGTVLWSSPHHFLERNYVVMAIYLCLEESFLG